MCLYLSTSLILGVVEKMQRVNESAKLALQRLTNKYNALLEAMPDCLLISNDDGDIIFANSGAETMFGYTAKELIGQKIECLIPARIATLHVSHRQHYLKKPKARPMGTGLVLRGKHKDGHEFSVGISLSPVETDEGLLVVTIVRDITEWKKSEDAKAMLLALMESSDEAIIGKDLNGTVFSWNRAAETLFGYTEVEMIGWNMKKLFPADKQAEFDNIIQQIADGGHIKQKESFRVHKDGHILPVWITVSPIKNIKGTVVGASTMARDITQQKVLEEKLKHLAEHDPLTGLINRPLFEDRIILAMLLSKRQKDSMAVCFLDIDDFKYINDQYGHATGDLLLCAVTERIQTCIRDIDTLARLGGEFALILLGLKKEQDVVKIVKKMIRLVAETFLIKNLTLNVTLSVGVALYPRDGESTLIEKADSAMYYVKNHGKNNFKLFDATLQLGRD